MPDLRTTKQHLQCTRLSYTARPNDTKPLPRPWRRERDLNPRSPFWGLTFLAGRRFRPLSHLSRQLYSSEFVKNVNANCERQRMSNVDYRLGTDDEWCVSFYAVSLSGRFVGNGSGMLLIPVSYYKCNKVLQIQKGKPYRSLLSAVHAFTESIFYWTWGENV